MTAARIDGTRAMRAEPLQVTASAGCDLAAQAFDSRESFAPLAAAFDALAARTGAPASARWDGIEAWLRHQRAVEPWGLLLRRGGEAVAGVLLARRRKAGVFLYRVAGQAGEPAWLPCADAAAARALARALGRALRATRGHWHLHLRDLAQAPVAAALHEELAIARLHEGAVVPQLHFTAEKPLGAYLSRNTRSAVAKAWNRICAAGLRHELAWTGEAAAIEACLGEIVDVHRRRNLQLRGHSALDEPGEAGIFVDTVRAHARGGRARLLTLRLDGALAAFAICLEAPGTLWVYANLASPDWLAFSPGMIANAEVVRAAHADPSIGCLDWGAGLQRYKLSGEVTLTRLHELHAWSSRAAWLGWAGLQLGRDALARLVD